MLDLLDTLSIWFQEPQPILLATLIQTWGSAPRQVGAKLAFRPDYTMVGSVSGGCVEGAVMQQGLALRDHLTQGQVLAFRVDDTLAWETGLSCGGNLQVYLEPLDQTWFAALRACMQQRQTCYSITAISGSHQGEKMVMNAANEIVYRTPKLPATSAQHWQIVARAQSQPRLITEHDSTLFIDVTQPQAHLIIVGGGHIAIPLHTLAHTLGFRTSLIDPRSAFATRQRFPHVTTISHAYPDSALPQLGLDPQTYIAVLTHDPKIDDPALITALHADVAYVGVLSSRQTHQRRLQRLREQGLSTSQLERIHAPIGLDIGAKTPQEIALSIMAQIVSQRASR